MPTLSGRSFFADGSSSFANWCGRQFRKVVRDEAGRNALPAQLIDATHALNLSAGVSNPRVLRGRSLSWRATLLR
jgi:hypothetical protein